MSKFRQRAAEIKAAGIAERGDFQPRGVPLKMYNYWLYNSEGLSATLIKKGYRKENFCHFWRVVAIWAPLLWFFKITDNKTGMVAKIALAVVILGLVIWALPESVTVLYCVAGGVAVCLAVVGLNAIWRPSWGEALSRVFLYLFAVIAIAYVILLITLGILAGGLIFLLWLALGIVGFAALVAIGSTLVNVLGRTIQGRRALAREEADRQERVAGAFGRERHEVYRPGIVKRFFSGLGDFIILISQVIRVNKWKICPLVEISPEEN